MHVRNSEVRTYDLLRKSVLRSFRMRKARLDVSPKPREARADQKRLRRPSGGVRHVAGGWEKHPSHQPSERGGRSWASRPSRCAVAARALTPIHSGSAPQAPARASGAFFKQRAGQGVGAARSPAGARTRPLDATGATQACRQGVGGALPRHPCPSARGPRQGRRRALYRRAVQGAPPAWGSRARSPWACAANKTLCRRRAFPCSSSFAFGSSSGPKRGLIYRYRRGERRKLDLARVCED